MLIIPAVDLLAGIVVHANGGKRKQYPPLHSELCRDADPFAVISSLLRLFPFPVIYLADLDALENGQEQSTLIQALQEGFSKLEFWVDAGHRAAYCTANKNIRTVLSSESGLGVDELKALPTPAPVLSLDFQAGSLLGRAELLEHPELWPQRVILMDLDRVGRAKGPNLPLWRSINAMAQQRQLYAAGGIRGVEDLQQLRKLGAAGALLSSALHDRRQLPGSVLSQLMPQPSLQIDGG